MSASKFESGPPLRGGAVVAAIAVGLAVSVGFALFLYLISYLASR